ncbi:uncharacterized protein NPIL_153501 [Nephila pilipes]|uniref:Uncharacterized protein n=1 Tax=Nephila pilipes TaxID=299642 RepID=A0A8X6PKV6_NEPPI|nr:uncharacterized protein NPIL_153501 [Nephila pilipes]
MRRKSDYTWFWNTGQNVAFHIFLLGFLLLCTRHSSAYPDFIDSMSRQFFGLPDDSNQQQQQHQQQYQQNNDPFSQMFGAHSQPVPSRPPPPPNYRHSQRRPDQPLQRQGYYAPQQVAYHQPHHPQPVAYHQPHHPQPIAYHPQQQHPPQPHPSYDGPPAVQGHQQGFGQVNTEGNETKTEGLPRDGKKPPYPPHTQHRQHHVATEYHVKHPHQPLEYHHTPETVEYHHPPPAAVEYQQPAVEYHSIPKHAVEYHHVPEQPVEHHGAAIEIHSNQDHHPHHEHVEYHHAPEVEYHHYPTHKPKRFHLSINQSPDYKIVDKHLKLPPVKFRFHINPKITITSNTKDPLDKKHHDDEHDLEPYPPPDAFSDHNAPPSYNEHTIEHYTPKHHYPVAHHEVKHYPVEHHEVKHYPVEHHAVQHYPVEHHVAAHPQPEYTYDLSRGHSHINPHRSSGHYEPTFKIKTRPIIFTEPPPTRPPTTTTRRTTTTTRRTTTTTTTTTARPRSRTRANLNARNPLFSVAFTQAPTTSTTSIARNGEVDDSTTSTSTTRRSTIGINSEREREDGTVSSRRDDPPSSSTTTTTTQPSTTTSTTTTTTTTPKPTTTSTSTTTTTTPRSTTISTTTTTERPTSTTTTTTAAPSTTRSTPAEETTPRTTPTLNVDANEIDMRKDSESPRRRPEPIREESLSVEHSESFNLENSESVKVIETTMLIDGKNQTVKFYYITQPVKLPLDVFQRVTGQKKSSSSGMSVIKIRDKRSTMDLYELQPIS